MQRLNFDTFDMNAFVELVDDRLDRMDELLNTGTYDIPVSLQQTFADLFAQILVGRGCMICPMSPNSDPIGILTEKHGGEYNPVHFTREEIHTMLEAFGFAVFGYKCGRCDKIHPGLIFNAEHHEDVTLAVIATTQVINAMTDTALDLADDEALIKICASTIMEAFNGKFAIQNLPESFPVNIQQFNINLN